MNDPKTWGEGTAPTRFTQAQNTHGNTLESARETTHAASLCAQIKHIAERIADAAHTGTHAAKETHILAVSKTVTAERLRLAYTCGLCTFGESYLQEARPKQEALSDLDIEWHFIGPVQANKTRPLAEHFAWVHSVDRLRIAERLSQQRPAHLPALNVCLQVNIDHEPSKAGVLPEELPALAHSVAALPRLKLRGLMAIPRPSDDPDEQADSFRRVRLLQENLLREGLALDTLSMGMSDDLEAAVAQGATWVRIGTAIFGARPTPPLKSTIK
ncbi:MAG: YggS family pyridoxal phosphate enzyme [Gammaproteobacteria bacterium 28-57-27]|nr:MAG: YggS family pyridoxal phosphate enzyme [Gammaproteobacteria bacterium 28-57-27]